MNRPRHHAFSRASLSQDQHWIAALRRAQNQLPYLVVSLGFSPEKPAKLRLSRQRRDQCRKAVRAGSRLHHSILPERAAPNLLKELSAHPKKINALLAGLLGVLKKPLNGLSQPPRCCDIHINKWNPPALPQQILRQALVLIFLAAVLEERLALAKQLQLRNPYHYRAWQTARPHSLAQRRRRINLNPDRQLLAAIQCALNWHGGATSLSMVYRV